MSLINNISTNRNKDYDQDVDGEHWTCGCFICQKCIADLIQPDFVRNIEGNRST